MLVVLPEANAPVALKVTSSPVAAALSLQLLMVDQFLSATPPASQAIAAAWTLVPDKLDEAPQATGTSHALIGTRVAFFVVEIGDKTQVATVALAARFQDVIAVTIGTTLGMMLANAPAVLLGEAIVARVSLRLVRRLAALLFAGLGIAMLARLWVPDLIPG